METKFSSSNSHEFDSSNHNRIGLKIITISTKPNLSMSKWVCLCVQKYLIWPCTYCFTYKYCIFYKFSSSFFTVTQSHFSPCASFDKILVAFASLILNLFLSSARILESAVWERKWLAHLEESPVAGLRFLPCACNTKIWISVFWNRRKESWFAVYVVRSNESTTCKWTDIEEFFCCFFFWGEWKKKVK